MIIIIQTYKTPLPGISGAVGGYEERIMKSRYADMATAWVVDMEQVKNAVVQAKQLSEMCILH